MCRYMRSQLGFVPTAWLRLERMKGGWKPLLVVGALAIASCSSAQKASTPTPVATTFSARSATTSMIVTTTTSRPPAIEIPEGFEIFDRADEGYVIALPDEWIVLDLRAENYEELLEPFRARLPQTVFDQIPAMAAAGISLLALDGFSSDPLFAANVNVAALPRLPVDDFETWEQNLPQTMEDLGAVIRSMERIQLPGGEALYTEFELPFGEVVILGRQYIVFTESTKYVISLADTLDGVEGDTLNIIISTFQPTR